MSNTVLQSHQNVPYVFYVVLKKPSTMLLKGDMQRFFTKLMKK